MHSQTPSRNTGRVFQNTSAPAEEHGDGRDDGTKRGDYCLTGWGACLTDGGRRLVGPTFDCVRLCVSLSVGSFLLCGCTTSPQKLRLTVRSLSRRIYRPPPPPDLFPYPLASESPRTNTSHPLHLFLQAPSFKSTKCLLPSSSPPPSPLRPPLAPLLAPLPAHGILSLPPPFLRQDLRPSSPAPVCPSRSPPRHHRLPPMPLTNPFRTKPIHSITSSEFRTPPPALVALVNRGTMSPLLLTMEKISPLTRDGTRKVDQRSHPPSPCSCSSMDSVSLNYLLTSAIMTYQFSDSVPNFLGLWISRPLYSPSCACRLGTHQNSRRAR
jgi:hypothetical protein